MTGASQNLTTSYKRDLTMGEEQPRIITQEIDYGFIELCYILKNKYPEMGELY
jgi:hypothetical protein